MCRRNLGVSTVAGRILRLTKQLEISNYVYSGNFTPLSMTYVEFKSDDAPPRFLVAQEAAPDFADSAEKGVEIRVSPVHREPGDENGVDRVVVAVSLLHMMRLLLLLRRVKVGMRSIRHHGVM